MCGIAGIYNLDRKSVDMDVIKKMIKVIKHRGPDDEGYYISEHIGLGHARLSIIDLSDSGHQPMGNEDGSVWIVHNGEIYNYKELADELKRAGHHFKSSSDTEVMIHAYEEWGADCVKRFNGMWAFAVWDSRKSQLFLSRDRLGVKPLYYHWDGKCIAFASEIKALLSLPTISRAYNEDIIRYFLDTGILDHSERTFFRDIRALPPAHSLLLNQDGLQKVRYWQLNISSSKKKMEIGDAAEEFRELLSDAIKIRMRSDVEVGSCLSGGLDSSSIVGLAAKMGIKFKTFSSVYSEKGYEEGQYVDIVANEYKTDKYVITPDPRSLPEEISKIVWFNDGPSTDPSIFSQWSVMRLAHGKLKVLLDGQGGDELLGGYHKYFPYYLNTLLKLGIKKDPLLIKEYLDLCGHLYKGKNMLKNILYCLSSLGTTKNDQQNDLNQEMVRDICNNRLPWLLHYEDRCSMAFSIESRTPFLDYRLVEYAVNLPFKYKIDHLNTKVILRAALKDILPPQIISRSDKKGYPTPAIRWFRDELRPYLGSIFNSDSFRKREIFKAYAVDVKMNEHVRGEKDHVAILWRCLTTELWFRQFIDNRVELSSELARMATKQLGGSKIEMTRKGI